MSNEFIDIVKAVFCRINNTTPALLPSRTRKQNVVETRRMVWGYLKEHTKMTFESLGQLFDRDHSTALHNIEKHFVASSLTRSGVIYDHNYTERYRSGVLELKHIFEGKTEDINYREYMLTYYCRTGKYYINPTVKASSLAEAIFEYEQYNPITDEELILAKAL
jgi:hypothetical protein